MCFAHDQVFDLVSLFFNMARAKKLPGFPAKEARPYKACNTHFNISPSPTGLPFELPFGRKHFVVTNPTERVSFFETFLEE